MNHHNSGRWEICSFAFFLSYLMTSTSLLSSHSSISISISVSSQFVFVIMFRHKGNILLALFYDFFLQYPLFVWCIERRRTVFEIGLRGTSCPHPLTGRVTATFSKNSMWWGEMFCFTEHQSSVMICWQKEVLL